MKIFVCDITNVNPLIYSFYLHFAFNVMYKTHTAQLGNSSVMDLTFGHKVTNKIPH